MSTDPDAPHGIPKLPDHTEALREWLQANGRGDMNEAGLPPLALYTLASRRSDMPPMPADVLFWWYALLDEFKIMWGQSVAAFIHEARKAGVSDSRTRLALLLNERVDLNEHAQQLLADSRAYAMLRHDRGLVNRSELPGSETSWGQPENPPKYQLSVEVERGSTPLWVGTGPRRGNVRQLGTLPLGVELIADLEAWADSFYRDDHRDADRERWVQQGRQLTDRVQAALGEGVVVTYRYDPKDRTSWPTST